jgi:hypothetical protein
MGEPEPRAPVLVDRELRWRERRAEQVPDQRLPSEVIVGRDHGVGVEGEAVLVRDPPALRESTGVWRSRVAPPLPLAIEDGALQRGGQLGVLLGGLVHGVFVEVDAPAREQADHAVAAGGEQSLDVVVGGVAEEDELGSCALVLGLEEHAVEREDVEVNVQIQGRPEALRGDQRSSEPRGNPILRERSRWNPMIARTSTLRTAAHRSGSKAMR